MIYAFQENFILPLSHDEVVHGKRTLLEKMPGDDWQKFANLRLLFGYMYAHPGKKLLFMGSELRSGTNSGKRAAWNGRWKSPRRIAEFSGSDGGSESPAHDRAAASSKWTSNGPGFEWIDANDAAASILSFIRRARNPEDFVVVVCNFTPVLRLDYRVGVPAAGYYREIVNTRFRILRRQRRRKCRRRARRTDSVE